MLWVAAMTTVQSSDNCFDEVVSPPENSEREGRSIGSLPDQLWLRVLRLGVGGGSLDYKDLCSLSFVSHRLRRLSASDSVWQLAFQRKFAPLADQPPSFSNPAKRKESDAPVLQKSKKRKETNPPHHRSFRNRPLVVKS